MTNCTLVYAINHDIMMKQTYVLTRNTSIFTPMFALLLRQPSHCTSWFSGYDFSQNIQSVESHFFTVSAIRDPWDVTTQTILHFIIIRE